MPAIPNGLAPVMQGYSTPGPGGAVRMEVDGGMARYALEYDQGLQLFDMAMVLTDAEFSVWTAFYQRVINKGSIAFDMPLDSGRGVETHSVRIVPGSYRAQRTAGVHVTVNFTVETQASIYSLTEADAQALIDAFVAGRGEPLVNLLRPLVSSYNFDGPGGVFRSQLAGGYSAYALAIDRDPQMFRVTLLLKPSEYEAWAAYYHQIVKKGVIVFPMYLDSGFGAALHTVNIVPGSYTAARAGALTAVSFVVEAEGQANDLSAADAQNYVDLFNAAGPEYDVLLARIADFANFDTLVLS